jgi:hypothetical protein
MYYVQPNLQSRMLKEGSEYDQFWKLLGIKSEYSSQKIARDPESDAHLFCCTFSKGKKEIIKFLICFLSVTPYHSVCALLICVLLFESIFSGITSG